MLQNVKASYPRPPKRSTYECDSQYASCIKGASEFDYGFQDATALFLVCRQIYLESIGVFYGLTTFTISRALHRHDLDRTELADPYSATQYCPLIFAPMWLSSLGSQSSLLEKVYIDADALCPSRCSDSERYVELLPLAKFLWKHPGLLECFSFTNTGRISNPHRDANNREVLAIGHAIDRTRKLGDLVKAIVTNDVLNLKQYIKLPSLMTSLAVCPSFRKLQILHPSTTARPGCFNKSMYAVTEDNSRLHFSKNVPKRDLFNLPLPARSSIKELFCYTAEEIVFDFDKRTVSGWVRPQYLPDLPQSKAILVQHSRTSQMWRDVKAEVLLDHHRL